MTKKEAVRANIERLYEAYRVDPKANEAEFFLAILKFAKIKMSHLEFEFGDGGCMNTVDDAAQEVVVTIFEQLPTFKGNGKKFYSWLASVSFKWKVNLFRELTTAKDEKRPIQIETELEDGSIGMEDNPALYGFTKGQISEGHSVLIPQDIQGVDRNICLMILDGKNQRQTADILGLTENAVELRLRRMKSCLAPMVAAKETRRKAAESSQSEAWKRREEQRLFREHQSREIEARLGLSKKEEDNVAREEVA
jgi:DNA-directed RNA polymerase specialized sigma24 family protein